MTKCKRCGGTGEELDHTLVGAMVRERREAAGLTLRKVAARSGWSAPYLSDLEHGRRNWTPVRQERVLRAIEAELGDRLDEPAPAKDD